MTGGLDSGEDSGTKLLMAIAIKTKQTNEALKEIKANSGHAYK